MTLNEKIKRIGRVKTELIVLSVLVPLVIVFGSLLVNWSALEKSNIGERVDVLPETTPLVSAIPEISVSNLLAEEQSEEVTLIIEKEGNKKSWQVEIEGEGTVEEVLTLAADEGYLDVKATDYGGSMGVFIESLGGVENNGIENIYWHLYINDVLSPVGATYATVKSGDRVTWKYEKQHDEN